MKEAIVIRFRVQLSKVSVRWNRIIIEIRAYLSSQDFTKESVLKGRSIDLQGREGGLFKKNMYHYQNKKKNKTKNKKNENKNNKWMKRKEEKPLTS